MRSEIPQPNDGKGESNGVPAMRRSIRGGFAPEQSWFKTEADRPGSLADHLSSGHTDVIAATLTDQRAVVAATVLPEVAKSQRGESPVMVIDLTGSNATYDLTEAAKAAGYGVNVNNASPDRLIQYLPSDKVAEVVVNTMPMSTGLTAPVEKMIVTDIHKAVTDGKDAPVLEGDQDARAQNSVLAQMGDALRLLRGVDAPDSRLSDEQRERLRDAFPSNARTPQVVDEITRLNALVESLLSAPPQHFDNFNADSPNDVQLWNFTVPNDGIEREAQETFLIESLAMDVADNNTPPEVPRHITVVGAENLSGMTLDRLVAACEKKRVTTTFVYGKLNDTMKSRGRVLSSHTPGSEQAKMASGFFPTFQGVEQTGESHDGNNSSRTDNYTHEGLFRKRTGSSETRAKKKPVPSRSYATSDRSRVHPSTLQGEDIKGFNGVTIRGILPGQWLLYDPASPTDKLDTFTLYDGSRQSAIPRVPSPSETGRRASELFQPRDVTVTSHQDAERETAEQFEEEEPLEDVTETEGQEIELREPSNALEIARGFLPSIRPNDIVEAVPVEARLMPLYARAKAVDLYQNTRRVGREFIKGLDAQEKKDLRIRKKQMERKVEADKSRLFTATRTEAIGAGLAAAPIVVDAVASMPGPAALGVVAAGAAIFENGRRRTKPARELKRIERRLKRHDKRNQMRNI